MVAGYGGREPLAGRLRRRTAGGPTQASAPSRMEQMLVQADFKIFPENSPKCQAVCQKLPPEQLVPEKKGDKMAYAYYAPGTQRLYVGDEAAYQNFINLAVMQNLEPRQACGDGNHSRRPGILDHVAKLPGRRLRSCRALFPRKEVDA